MEGLVRMTGVTVDDLRDHVSDPVCTEELRSRIKIALHVDGAPRRCPGPPSTRKMAPAHGEDTERLLIELLDYTWDDIASLQEDGVIL